MKRGCRSLALLDLLALDQAEPPGLQEQGGADFEGDQRDRDLDPVGKGWLVTASAATSRIISVSV